MAWRFSEYVLGGEIRSSSNAVHGWLELDGAAGPDVPAVIHFELTGQLGGELAGRSFRFDCRPAGEARRRWDADPPHNVVFGPAWRDVQYGVAGDCHLRMHRVPQVPLAEFMEASRAGLPVPESLLPVLTLEWHSAQGRVVIELVDPLIEGCDEWVPLQVEDFDSDNSGNFEAFLFRETEDGSWEQERIVSGEVDDIPEDDSSDPYELFPKPLDRTLRDALRPWSPETEADSWSETINESIDSTLKGPGNHGPTPVSNDPLDPKSIRDEQSAWLHLKSLLTGLALRGTSLQICEHFSARAAHELLVVRILPELDDGQRPSEASPHRRLSTADYCPQCLRQRRAT